MCHRREKVANFLLKLYTQTIFYRINRRLTDQPSSPLFSVGKDASLAAKNNKTEIVLPFLDKKKIR